MRNRVQLSMNSGIWIIIAIIVFAATSVWVDSLVHRYPSYYYVVAHAAITFVFLSWGKNALKSRGLSGFVLGALAGYAVSVIVNLSLEFLFYPYFVENLLLSMENNASRVALGIFAYPLLFGGWIFGGFLYVAMENRNKGGSTL